MKKLIISFITTLSLMLVMPFLSKPVKANNGNLLKIMNLETYEVVETSIRQFKITHLKESGTVEAYDKDNNQIGSSATNDDFITFYKTYDDDQVDFYFENSKDSYGPRGPMP